MMPNVYREKYDLSRAIIQFRSFNYLNGAYMIQLLSSRSEEA